MQTFFATMATFAPCLIVAGLTIPFLMPRRGAALGMMLIGWGTTIFPRAIGTWAIVYGAVWIAIGIATHALRRRTTKAEETTCRAALTGS